MLELYVYVPGDETVAALSVLSFRAGGQIGLDYQVRMLQPGLIWRLR